MEIKIDADMMEYLRDLRSRKESTEKEAGLLK